jgi:hypothetical protein
MNNKKYMPSKLRNSYSANDFLLSSLAKPISNIVVISNTENTEIQQNQKISPQQIFPEYPPGLNMEPVKVQKPTY